MKHHPVHIEPWGRLRGSTHQAQSLQWGDQPFPMPTGKTTLAFGMGRSYGDVCINPDQGICLTRDLNRFHFFDEETGYLTCDAGVSLDEILTTFVPKGWFPPVVPGTKFITVGGAIANDIHGKNHHVAGTWGAHITQLTLLRSDQPKPIVCSPEHNAELFKATIGGLGLTGIILSATIKLQPIQSAFIHAEYTPFKTIEEFFELSSTAEGWEHTVAWIDLTCPNGRGVFMKGRFETKPSDKSLTTHKQGGMKLPFNLPNWAVNKLSIRAFNAAYRHGFRHQKEERCHYDPFFFPLDKVHQWNRAYGSRGFFQYQSVIPGTDTVAATKEMLREVSQSGNGSPLAVLKNFGAASSPGLMSFPTKGTTLAMDLANTGWETLELMGRLDAIVNTAGGRLYPAKDIRMRASDFQTQYPQWEKLEALRDPALLSNFWKRVTCQPKAN